VSISLNPGTNLARHAGSFLHRFGRLFKFAAYYVISCGDVSFVTDESKGPTDLKTHARNRAEDAVTHLETGELPNMDGIDITGSHGAITSLYAGAAPGAGDLNGGVCSPASSTASECRLTFFPSISLPGRAPHFHTRRLLTSTPRRSCGIGVKTR
jgi:hypothetical protein